MVQVLIFGTVLTSGGYDKAEAKILQGRSLFNLVLSVDNALLCMFQRLWTYFQDIGVLIFGGVCTFGALRPAANFCKKWRGTYFRRGTYLRDFTVFSYFRTFEKVLNMKIPFCFENLDFQRHSVLRSKICSYEPVSSQKYENGYQTKMCDFTVCHADFLYIFHLVRTYFVSFCFQSSFPPFYWTLRPVKWSRSSSSMFSPWRIHDSALSARSLQE